MLEFGLVCTEGRTKSRKRRTGSDETRLAGRCPRTRRAAHDARRRTRAARGVGRIYFRCCKTTSRRTTSSSSRWAHRIPGRRAPTSSERWFGTRLRISDVIDITGRVCARGGRGFDRDAKCGYACASAVQRFSMWRHKEDPAQARHSNLICRFFLPPGTRIHARLTESARSTHIEDCGMEDTMIVHRRRAGAARAGSRGGPGSRATRRWSAPAGRPW